MVNVHLFGASRGLLGCIDRLNVVNLVEAPVVEQMTRVAYNQVINFKSYTYISKVKIHRKNSFSLVMD